MLSSHMASVTRCASSTCLTRGMRQSAQCTTNAALLILTNAVSLMPLYVRPRWSYSDTSAFRSTMVPSPPVSVAPLAFLYDKYFLGYDGFVSNKNLILV